MKKSSILITFIVVLTVGYAQTAFADSVCDPGCDYCWCGTGFENNCPIEWMYDADCDCGCQFCDLACPNCDMQGCDGPIVGACCCPDMTCYNSVSEADCLSVGCVFQGIGSTCSQGCPCAALPLPCDYCWLGTAYENNCPPEWYGADDGCDCGCQWQDPDCGITPTTTTPTTTSSTTTTTTPIPVPEYPTQNIPVIISLLAISAMFFVTKRK